VNHVPPIRASKLACFRTSRGIFLSLEWRIYKLLTNENDTTFAIFAGSGNRSQIDGQGLFCSFQRPIGLAADRAGNIYVADGAAVRKISPDASVTTIVSESALSLESIASNPDGVVCWSTYFWVRRFIAGNASVLGGKNGVVGFNDGESVVSLFMGPQGVAFGPDNRLYVADTANNRIRRITFDAIPATQLGIDLRPTLTITGPVGGRFRIEARDSLAEPWSPVVTITLTNNPTLWTDLSFPNSSKRFYRSVREQ
jgi:DNA-binding beta-propeller fold protein YncE